MKKIILLLIILNTVDAFTQETVGGKVAQKTKDKVTNRTEQKTDEVIDNTLNKIEEGITNIFKKKKKTTNENPQQEIKNVNSNLPYYDAQVTKTDNLGNTDYSAYKNFEFTTASSTLFYEDFTDKNTNRWGAYDTNQLNIITNDGKNWLEVKSGSFYPLGLKELPANFTLEFDVYTPNKNTGTLEIRFLDNSQANSMADPWIDNCSIVNLSPITQMPKTGLGSYQVKIDNEEKNPKNEFKFFSWQPELENYYAHISLKREDTKLSLWINKEKVLDNIEFFLKNREHLLAFLLQNYFVEENKMYLTNFKLATGFANFNNDFASTSKFVTHNILFDTNSDVIRPNSYSILKQIAETISSIDSKIQIIGHTDSDGSDAQNLLLSIKRAEAVKRALVFEFGIDAAKLITDGKGESNPLNKNTTPQEKAQNRRVEFVKQ